MNDTLKEKQGAGMPATALRGKHQDLLDELSDLVDKAGGQYGPFFMEKLHARLDLVVKNFNQEVESLLHASFNNWRVQDEQLRELLKNKLHPPKKKPKKKAKKKSTTPNFLKDIEFGPIHNK